MPLIEDRLRVILEPLAGESHGCAEGSLFRAVWSNVNPVDLTGVNEMWLNPELSTGTLPDGCPRCLVPKGLIKKCLDGSTYYDVPSHITIHQGESADEWCSLELPATCLVAEHLKNDGSPNPCLNWEYGDYTAGISSCTETIARVIYLQGVDPHTWYVQVFLRPLSCESEGDCQLLQFLSALFTLPEGGIDEEDKITQVGVDYLNGLVAAGLTVNRTDAGTCKPTLTSLVVSLAVCATADLVTCCFGNGSTSQMTPCACAAADGRVLSGEPDDPCECNPDADEGIFVFCCIDGVVGFAYAKCGESSESACAAVGGVPTTVAPGETIGDPCDDYTGGGGSCGGSVTYQFAYSSDPDDPGSWYLIEGTVPTSCCPVGPFPSSPTAGQTFVTTLEAC